VQPGASLHDYWIELYSRRRLLGVVALSAGLFAYLVSLLLPALYEARSIFYIPVNLDPTPFTGTSSVEHLAQNPAFPVPEEKMAGINIGILKGKDLLRNLAGEFPGSSVDALGKNLDVVLGSEFLIEVYVRDRDPERAAAIANRVPQIYRAFHVEVLRERVEGIRETLATQLDSVGKRIDVAQAQVRTAQRVAGVLSPEVAEAEAVELIQRLRADLEDTTTRLAASQARIESLDEELRNERKLYREGELVLTSPTIDRHLERLSELEGELGGMTPGVYHPKGRESLEAQIAKTRRDLESEVSNLVRSQSKPHGSIHERIRGDLIEQSVEVQYLAARRSALEASLQRALHRQRQQVVDSGRVGVIKGRIAYLESLRERIEANLIEATMQAENPPVSVVVVETATAPTRPVFPRPVLNAFVATILGLVVGCYYALFLGYLSRLKQARMRRQMDWSPLVAGPRVPARSGAARGEIEELHEYRR
jgi:uncharacterized protein involved in exopolysaccharide biosynthesis